MENRVQSFFLFLIVLFSLPTQLCAWLLSAFITLPKTQHIQRLKMYILNHNKSIPNKALLESNFSLWGAFHLCNLILCLEIFTSGKKYTV